MISLNTVYIFFVVASRIYRLRETVVCACQTAHLNTENLMELCVCVYVCARAQFFRSCYGDPFLQGHCQTLQRCIEAEVLETEK